MSNVQQKRNIINSKSKLSRPVKNAKTTNLTEVVSGSMIVEEEAETEDVNIDVETSEIPVLTPTANITTSVTTTTTTVVQSQPIEKVIYFLMIFSKFFSLHKLYVIFKVTVMTGTSLLQPKLPVSSSVCFCIIFLVFYFIFITLCEIFSNKYSKEIPIPYHQILPEA